MLAGLLVLALLAQVDPAQEWAPPPSSTTPPPPPSSAPGPDPFLPPPPPSQVEPRLLDDEPKPPPPEAEVIETRAPDPKRFTWGHVGLALTGAFGESGYFGVRAEAGAVYGWPKRIGDTLSHAMGPTIGVALDLLAAKLRVPSCGDAGICGSRYQAGLALRAAWNWGVIGTDAVVAPVHSVFLQVVPFLSSNNVPSAPLAPGSTWGEHGVRVDLGLTSGYLRGSTWPKPGSFVLGGGLYFALSLETLIVNTVETGRFRFGLSLGVGL